VREKQGPHDSRISQLRAKIVAKRVASQIKGQRDTRFAKSIPIIVTSDMDAPSYCDGFNTHHNGTLRCRREGHPRHQQSPRHP